MNILTFDVEEWFHLLDFDETRTEDKWSKYPVRIYENIDRILNILEETDTKATFFIIGWIAKTYPDIVKKIAEKYQIGSHTMTHQLVWQQSKNEFKNDVETSIKLLQDITGQPIECFRAPGFSIRKSEGWAFEILNELGIKYDCSVFPAHHAHGGLPEYGHAKPRLIRYNNIEMREFPICAKEIAGKHIIFSGGGYFRLIPYHLIKQWTKECNDYCLAYIHPRDLDYGQPMLKDLPLSRKFKSYVGLKTAENKLRKYLKDFKFTDIRSTADNINWTSVPVIDI